MSIERASVPCVGAAESGKPTRVCESTCRFCRGEAGVLARVLHVSHRA